LEVEDYEGKEFVDKKVEIEGVLVWNLSKKKSEKVEEKK
jgi:hypothetical protein